MGRRIARRVAFRKRRPARGGSRGGKRKRGQFSDVGEMFFDRLIREPPRKRRMQGLIDGLHSLTGGARKSSRGTMRGSVRRGISRRGGSRKRVSTRARSSRRLTARKIKLMIAANDRVTINGVFRVTSAKNLAGIFEFPVKYGVMEATHQQLYSVSSGTAANVYVAGNGLDLFGMLKTPSIPWADLRTEMNMLHSTIKFKIVNVGNTKCFIDLYRCAPRVNTEYADQEDGSPFLVEQIDKEIGDSGGSELQTAIGYNPFIPKTRITWLWRVKRHLKWSMDAGASKTLNFDITHKKPLYRFMFETTAGASAWSKQYMRGISEVFYWRVSGDVASSVNGGQEDLNVGIGPAGINVMYEVHTGGVRVLDNQVSRYHTDPTSNYKMNAANDARMVVDETGEVAAVTLS